MLIPSVSGRRAGMRQPDSRGKTVTSRRSGNEMTCYRLLPRSFSPSAHLGTFSTPPRSTHAPLGEEHRHDPWPESSEVKRDPSSSTELPSLRYTSKVPRIRLGTYACRVPTLVPTLNPFFEQRPRYPPPEDRCRTPYPDTPTSSGPSISRPSTRQLRRSSSPMGSHAHTTHMETGTQ